jgi:hypothetical protein
MAYRDFKSADLQEKFGIINQTVQLFNNNKIVEPSAWLVETLARQRVSIRNTTEKAVSEAIISPILSEIQVNNKNLISLFSGENLNADREVGLNGEVDFLYVRDPNAYELSSPIISVMEAKLDKAISKSFNQAIAQMIGAQVFNKKNNQPYPIIFGVVTNSFEWRFFKLEGKILSIDSRQYSLNELPQLLGALQTIIDFYE